MVWDDFEAHALTGLNGALHLIRSLKPSMARSFGRFIHIGTNLFRICRSLPHYTAIKASLVALTRTAAAELGPNGITVNMVSGGLYGPPTPGSTDAF